MPNRRQFLLGTGAVLLVSKLRSVRQPIQVASTPLPVGTEQINQLFVGGSNASDTNPGTASAPFATIQAAADVAQPGVTVRIRDGVYRETVAPAYSGTEVAPITFEADIRPDGSKCEPVISGANLVTTNWTLANHVNLPNVHPVTKPIYQTTIAFPHEGYPGVEGAPNAPSYLEPLANQVFVRSKMAPEARWPKVADTDDPMNVANFRELVANRPSDGTTRWGIDWSNFNNPRLNDPEMPRIPGGWVGGYIKHYHSWMPTTCAINYSEADGIRWLHEDSAITGADLRNFDLNDWRPNTTHHYHLFGRIGALTTPGEWFYENGTLYLWAPAGGVPANVEYKARALGFDLTGRRCVTVKDLNFFACEVHDNGGSIFPTGWGVANPWRNNIIHAPNDRIVIDGCRFKYQNHVDTIPFTGGPAWANQSRPLSYVHWWEMLENRYPGPDFRQSRVMQSGIRLTGDNSVVRNCVMKVAASSAVQFFGRNCLAQNNYLSHVGYCGSYSPAISMWGLSFGSKALRNTVHDVCRSAITPHGQYQECAYNNMYNHSKLSVDGGCIYIHHFWNTDHAVGSRQSMLAITPLLTLPGTQYTGNYTHEAYGVDIHHNWIHDYATWGSTGAGPNRAMDKATGTYYDTGVDGILTHHNVYWNNNQWDAWSHEGDDRDQVGGFRNRFYNNTFGSGPAVINEQANRRCINAGYSELMYAGDEYNNNIYLHSQGADRDWSEATGIDLRYALKPTEMRYITQAMINSGQVFNGAAHVVPQDPGLVSYAASLATSGLDFQLAPGSPCINRGVPIDGTLDNLDQPIVGVDDFDGPAPDCGAYEFGRTPWVPGCDLSQEFIDGEPWKRQWD